MSLVARGSGGFSHDIHAATFAVKLHFAVHEGEEGPVAAHADVLASFEFGTALTNDDAAGSNNLATVTFHAEALADAVASVTYTALTFLV